MDNYNVSEHKSHTKGALVEKDRSPYVKGSTQRYTHNAPPTEVHKSSPNGGASDTANVSLAENQIVPPYYSINSSPYSAQSATAPNMGRMPIESSFSDVREEGEKYSYFNKDLSFQRQEDLGISNGFQKEKDLGGEKKPNLHKSNESRYFRRNKESTDRQSLGNRYLVNTAESQKARDSTSSRLSIAGVSSVVTPTVVSISQEDSNGGEMISESAKFADTSIHTVDKVYKVSSKIAEIEATKQVSSQATQQATQAVASSTVSATSSAVEQGAQGTGVAATTSASLPFFIIFILLVATVISMLFLFMLGGILGGGSFLGSALAVKSQETDVLFTDPNTKNSTDLVLWCNHAVDNEWGYVYGAFGQLCTLDYLKQQAHTYPRPDEAGGPMFEAGKQWIGKNVVDCIGLIKSYAWYNPQMKYIEYGTNGFTDCGANSIWNNVTVSGNINTMPDIPGLAVWKNGHIGVYVGDGYVVEAMGTRYGVVKTKLENGNWTKWLQIPNIEYKNVSETQTQRAEKILTDNR